ncbi:hypothetical protein L1D13_11050, partial [Vibrio tubiashii]
MSDMNKTLYIVHCIDTEGPLTEDISDTFDRIESIYDIKLGLHSNPDNLKKLQRKELDLAGLENEIAKLVSPELLNYNNSWQDVRNMLLDCLSEDFRNKTIDDFGNGWVYSWHCMDHAGYSDNPRRKDLGYGNVYKFYKNILAETNSTQDEINWHYHPLPFDRNPLRCAVNYSNSFDVLLQVLTRRVIDEGWFPSVNRPGFHSERQDIHMFLEQWIPFDYANQSYDFDDGQQDLIGGRFGDWRRAPKTWRGYNPHHDDYQTEGGCRRTIFRCLNVGTRFNLLKISHVREAFKEAQEEGSAILSFSNHDYREMRGDIDYVRGLLSECRSEFPDVKIAFAGANEAARNIAIRSKPQDTDVIL